MRTRFAWALLLLSPLCLAARQALRKGSSDDREAAVEDLRSEPAARLRTPRASDAWLVRQPLASTGVAMPLGGAQDARRLQATSVHPRNVAGQRKLQGGDDGEYAPPVPIATEDDDMGDQLNEGGQADNPAPAPAPGPEEPEEPEDPNKPPDNGGSGRWTGGDQSYPQPGATVQEPPSIDYSSLFMMFAIVLTLVGGCAWWRRRQQQKQQYSYTPVAQGEQEMAHMDNQWDWDEEDNYTAQEQHRHRHLDSWDDYEDAEPSNSHPYASAMQASSAPASGTRQSSTSSPVQDNADDLFAALEMNAAPRFNHVAAPPKPQPVKYNNTSRISTLAADAAVTASKGTGWDDLDDLDGLDDT